VSSSELFLGRLVSDWLLSGLLLLFRLFTKIIEGAEVISGGCDGKTTSRNEAGRLDLEAG
jgi:hypothetical protein